MCEMSDKWVREGVEIGEKRGEMRGEKIGVKKGPHAGSACGPFSKQVRLTTEDIVPMGLFRAANGIPIRLVFLRPPLAQDGQQLFHPYRLLCPEHSRILPARVGHLTCDIWQIRFPGNRLY